MNRKTQRRWIKGHQVQQAFFALKNSSFAVLLLGVFIFVFFTKVYPKLIAKSSSSKSSLKEVDSSDTGVKFLDALPEKSTDQIIGYSSRMVNPLTKTVPEQVAWANDRLRLVKELRTRTEDVAASNEAELMEMEALKVLITIGETNGKSFHDLTFQLQDLIEKNKSSSRIDLRVAACNYELLMRLQKFLDSSDEVRLDEYLETLKAFPAEVREHPEFASYVVDSGIQMATAENFKLAGIELLKQAYKLFAVSKDADTVANASRAFKFVFEGEERLRELRSRILAGDEQAINEVEERLDIASIKVDLSLDDCLHIISFTELLTNTQNFDSAKELVRKLLASTERISSPNLRRLANRKAVNASKRIQQYGKSFASLDIKWISDLSQYDLAVVQPTTVAYWTPSSALSVTKLKQLYQRSVYNESLVIAVCVQMESDERYLDDDILAMSKRMPKFLFGVTSESSQFYNQYPVEFFPTFVVLSERKVVDWVSSDLPGIESQIARLATENR